MTRDDASPRTDAVQIEEIDGEAVLYEPVGATLHHLNATGLEIWHLARSELGDVRIVAELAARHGVAPEAIRDDVVGLLDDLRRRGLLGAPPAPDDSPTPDPG